MANHTNLRDLFTAIADAIRSKTGSSTPIVADNFPDEIRTLATHEDEDAIIEGTLSEYTNDRVTSIARSMFYHNTSLVSVNFPKVKSVHGTAFAECEKLTTVNMPQVENVGYGQYGSAFQNCPRLKEFIAPKIRHIGAYSFSYCLSLVKVDIGLETNSLTTDICRIGYCAFDGTKLKELIIRRKTFVYGLEENALRGTPIANGTGYIYVPRDVIVQYRLLDQWCNVESQIRALEDYTVDGTITGELDPNKI